MVKTGGNFTLKGLGTALVTPFRDGDVDYKAFATLVDMQVLGSVDFLVMTRRWPLQNWLHHAAEDFLSWSG